MAWRVAVSLQTLLAQVNAAHPDRSKASDGSIGDTAHAAAGTSDHLPDKAGIVRARDFTDDPAHGCDASELADRLLAAQDPRLKYLISDARIGSGPAGPQPGVWRAYAGTNAHRKHAHVSVVPDARADQAHPWAGVTAGPLGSRIPPGQPEDDMLNDTDKTWISDVVFAMIRSEGLSGAGDLGRTVAFLEPRVRQWVAEEATKVLRVEGVSGAADLSRTLAALAPLVAAVDEGLSDVDVQRVAHAVGLLTAEEIAERLMVIAKPAASQ